MKQSKDFWAIAPLIVVGVFLSSCQKRPTNIATGGLGIDYVETCGQHGRTSYALYLCTEDNYVPEDWRIDSDHKSVSHRFDKSKKWIKVWDVRPESPYRVCRMEARDTRGGGAEWLGPNRRDIILVIDER